MKRKPENDVRDRELGALLRAAVDAQVGSRGKERDRRIPSRRLGLSPGHLIPFAAAAAVLVVAVGGASLGHTALARRAALRNSLAFAQDVLRESPASLYLDLPPPGGRDAEALAGFIDDLWAEPEGGMPR